MGINQAAPHYEIPAGEFANWLEQQAPDSWWNVDGDPLLTGRLLMPCPSDELASEMRKIGRPLLVDALNDANAKGQIIDASKLGHLTPLPTRLWANERFFRLWWKGMPHEWFLVEDSESAKQFRADASSQMK